MINNCKCDLCGRDIYKTSLFRDENNMPYVKYGVSNIPSTNNLFIMSDKVIEDKDKNISVESKEKFLEYLNITLDEIAQQVSDECTCLCYNCINVVSDKLSSISSVSVNTSTLYKNVKELSDVMNKILNSSLQDESLRVLCTTSKPLIDSILDKYRLLSLDEDVKEAFIRHSLNNWYEDTKEEYLNDK